MSEHTKVKPARGIESAPHTGSIKIVLEITDEDTIWAYGDINQSFIEDDIRNGTLMKMCNVVSIESNATGEAEEN